MQNFQGYCKIQESEEEIKAAAEPETF